MSVERNDSYLSGLVTELRKMPKETEWVEFKANNSKPEEIGEYLSALSNAAALAGKTVAYLVWGIDDKSHDIVGTKFNPKTAKVGNEELESWLLRLISPRIDFHFYSFNIEQKTIVLLEIGAAFRHPVRFREVEYVRIGTCKKKLKGFPEKERELWRIFDQIPFEKEIAAESVPDADVLRLINYPAFFSILNRPLPENRTTILGELAAENMIQQHLENTWDITNLGATLFATKLDDFTHLKRKSVRVVEYKSDELIKTSREREGTKGYAAGFEGLIRYVTNLLPSNEEIGKAFRKDVPMFPNLAIRELIANAIIHQDFHISGTGPIVELFTNRMEISNPGLPLVEIDRFLDSPPRSRNEALASFMRRIGICEERGSGIDKVVFQTELFQLPAPLFETTKEHTRVVLFAHREFKNMDKADRIRACYQHACLRYVKRVNAVEKMNYFMKALKVYERRLRRYPLIKYRIRSLQQSLL